MMETRKRRALQGEISMSSQAGGAAKAPSSEQIVERLLQRVSKDQLRRLVEVAAANSGHTVANAAYEPGDDICPTFHFPYPLPPRFDQFLNEATALGKVRLFPYGIWNPEGVLVQVGIQLNS
jgi:hypothetical protein